MVVFPRQIHHETKSNNENINNHNSTNFKNEIVIQTIKRIIKIKRTQNSEFKMANKIKVKNTTINNNVDNTN